MPITITLIQIWANPGCCGSTSGSNANIKHYATCGRIPQEVVCIVHDMTWHTTLAITAWNPSVLRLLFHWSVHVCMVGASETFTCIMQLVCIEYVKNRTPVCLYSHAWSAVLPTAECQSSMHTDDLEREAGNVYSRKQQ